jgi:hypothetical protein
MKKHLARRAALARRAQEQEERKKKLEELKKMKDEKGQDDKNKVKLKRKTSEDETASEGKKRERSGRSLEGLPLVYRRRLLDHLSTHFPAQKIDVNSQEHMGWAVDEFFPGSRQWYFEQFDRWLHSAKSRVFWLRGPIGVGKTQFMVELCSRYTRRKPKEDPEKKGQQEQAKYKEEPNVKFLAHYFCNRLHTQMSDPMHLLRVLVYELSEHVPEYRDALLGVSPATMEAARLSGNVEQSYRCLLTEPMSHVLRQSSPVVIVLDAIDELQDEETALTDDDRNGQSVLKVLASQLQQLPSWLRLVLTSNTPTTWEGEAMEAKRRNFTEVVETSLGKLSPLILDLDGEQNGKDIEAYARHILSDRIEEERLDTAVSCLVTKSQSTFLYFWLMREELQKPELDIDELQIFFPESVIDAIAKAFSDEFRPDMFQDTDKSFAWELAQQAWKGAASLLQLVISAREPLPLYLAAEMLGWKKRDGTVDERRAPLRGLQDPFFPVRDLCFYSKHDLILQWLTRPPPSATAAKETVGKEEKKPGAKEEEKKEDKEDVGTGGREDEYRINPVVGHRIFATALFNKAFKRGDLCLQRQLQFGDFSSETGGGGNDVEGQEGKGSGADDDEGSDDKGNEEGEGEGEDGEKQSQAQQQRAAAAASQTVAQNAALAAKAAVVDNGGAENVAKAVILYKVNHLLKHLLVRAEKSPSLQMGGYLQVWNEIDEVVCSLPWAEARLMANQGTDLMRELLEVGFKAHRRRGALKDEEVAIGDRKRDRRTTQQLADIAEKCAALEKLSTHCHSMLAFLNLHMYLLRDRPNFIYQLAVNQPAGLHISQVARSDQLRESNPCDCFILMIKKDTDKSAYEHDPPWIRLDDAEQERARREREKELDELAAKKKIGVKKKKKKKKLTEEQKKEEEAKKKADAEARIAEASAAAGKLVDTEAGSTVASLVIRVPISEDRRKHREARRERDKAASSSSSYGSSVATSSFASAAAMATGKKADKSGSPKKKKRADANDEAKNGPATESVLLTMRGKTISLWNANEGQHRKRLSTKQLEDERRRQERLLKVQAIGSKAAVVGMGNELRRNPTLGGGMSTAALLALKDQEKKNRQLKAIAAKKAAADNKGELNGKGKKGGEEAMVKYVEGEDGDGDGGGALEEAPLIDDGTDALFNDMFVAGKRMDENGVEIEDDDEEEDEGGKAVYVPRESAKVWQGPSEYWGLDGAASMPLEEQTKLMAEEVVEQEDRLLLKGHRDKVMCCDASADGSLLASGSADTTVILWDLVTGEVVRTFTGHEDTVSCVCCVGPSVIITGAWDRCG